MKVLQILPALNVGGVERGVIDLARSMKARGEQTVVISSGGELVAKLQKLGVTHYQLPVHKKSLLSLALVPKIAGIIRRERIDLVHARSRVPGWLAWLAARQTGTPFITTCHGYYSTHLMSRVMGWGKRVIVISRIIGRHMMDDFGVNPDHIRMVHRGVDLEQFQAVRERVTKKEGEPFRIINVGRFSPIKGQVEFLKAVHLLRQKVQHIEVVLVGSEAKRKRKYTEVIHQTIEQLGLQSCVKLLGTRRDIPELIAQSDLLVLSTLVPEAFGRVIIEAGAVGVPVLSTKVGGVLDILEDEEPNANGWLVPAGDTEAMSAGIEEAIRDSAKRKRYAEALQAKVERMFSLEHMTDQELAVYREAIEDKKILVQKLGAMGDVILTIPSLRMLRNRFPDAFISVMVDRKWASYLSNVPYINETISVDRKRLREFGYFLKIAKKIRSEHFDISIDFQNSKWTHLLAFLGNIKERFGFRRGKLGFLLNRPDTSCDTCEAPVDHQYRILAKLGVPEKDARLELWSDAQADAAFTEKYGDLRAGSAARLIGFVMGSSPGWRSKRWPIGHYLELGKALVKDSNTRICFLGSPSDRETLAEDPAFEALLDLPNSIDFIGKTTQEELVSLVKLLDAVVTGDTAPLHIANAFGKPVIALFGPTDPKRHMQPSDNASALSRHLECQPCYEGICKNQDKLACLKQISSEEVFNSVQKKIQNEKVRS